MSSDGAHCGVQPRSEKRMGHEVGGSRGAILNHVYVRVHAPLPGSGLPKQGDPLPAALCGQRLGIRQHPQPEP